MLSVKGYDLPLGRTSSEEAARQQVFDITLPISCLQKTWRLSQRQIRKTWPSVWKHLLLRRKGSCTQAGISLRRNIALQHVFRPNARFQHLNMLLSWGCQLGNCFCHSDYAICSWILNTWPSASLRGTANGTFATFPSSTASQIPRALLLHFRLSRWCRALLKKALFSMRNSTTYENVAEVGLWRSTLYCLHRGAGSLKSGF